MQALVLLVLASPMYHTPTLLLYSNAKYSQCSYLTPVRSPLCDVLVLYSAPHVSSTSPHKSWSSAFLLQLAYPHKIQNSLCSKSSTAQLTLVASLAACPPLGGLIMCPPRGREGSLYTMWAGGAGRQGMVRHNGVDNLGAHTRVGNLEIDVWLTATPIFFYFGV